jgi:hypothetical protein
MAIYISGIAPGLTFLQIFMPDTYVFGVKI